jgi:hypothetical protein
MRVDRLAVGDRHDPRAQVGRARARIRAQRAQECVLEAIVDLVVRHDRGQEAVDLVAVAVEEDLERRPPHAYETSRIVGT